MFLPLNKKIKIQTKIKQNKVLTISAYADIVGHIEKQQTKKPAITPVKKFTFVGKNTRRYKMMEWIGQLLAMIILIGGAFVVGVECGGAVSKKEGK